MASDALGVSSAADAKLAAMNIEIFINPDYDDSTPDTIENESENRTETFVPACVEKVDMSDKPPLCCDQCDRQFVSHKFHLKHQVNHLFKQSFVCQHCHKETSSERDLHLTTLSADDEVKKHSSEVGDTMFEDEAVLEHHLKNPRAIKKMKAWSGSEGSLEKQSLNIVGCGTSMSLSADRQAPVTTQNVTDLMDKESDDDKLPSDSSTFTCPSCDKSFSSVSELEMHCNEQTNILGHINMMKYTCSVCVRTFVRKCIWKIHMKTHGGEHAYGCTYCPERFITSRKLKFHMKSKHCCVKLNNVITDVSGNLSNKMEKTDVSIDDTGNVCVNGDNEVCPRGLNKLLEDPHRNTPVTARKIKLEHGDPDDTLVMQTLTDAEQHGQSGTAVMHAHSQHMKERNSQAPFMLPLATVEGVPLSIPYKNINGPSTAPVQDTPVNDGTLVSQSKEKSSKARSFGTNDNTKTGKKTKPAALCSNIYTGNDFVISVDSVSSGQTAGNGVAVPLSKICNTLEPEKMRSTMPEEENVLLKMKEIQMYFSCSICNLKFTTKETLRTHQNVHPKESLFGCVQCGLGFICASDLQVHCKTHKKKKKCECQYCGRLFAKSYNLKSHVRTHTGEKPFKCGICDKRFTALAGLRYHERKRTPQNCCKGMDKGNSYKSCHQQTPDSITNAAKKGKNTRNIPKLAKNKDDIANDRQNREDGSVEANTYCQVSKEVSNIPVINHAYKLKALTKTPKKLKASKHVLNVSVGKGKIDGSEQKGDIQPEAMTIRKARKKYVHCPLCPKILSNQIGLKKHIRIHTGEKPYKCRTCNKRFAHYDTHHKHKLTHIGEELHRCDVSDKPSNLESHLKGQKPALYGKLRRSDKEYLAVYQCDVCQLEWKSKESLHEHMATHDHQCPKCNRAFSNNRLYQIHCGNCEGPVGDNRAKKPEVTVTCEGFEITCSPPGSDIEDEDFNILHAQEMKDLDESDGELNDVVDDMDGAEAVSETSEEQTKEWYKQKTKNSCTSCGDTFRSFSTMILHLLQHKGPKIFPCPLCRFTCSSLQHLKDHEMEHDNEHGSPTNKSFYVRCNVCGKSFETHELMKAHYTEHLGGDVYKCSKCHKMFKQFPDLNKHSKTCKVSLKHVKAFSCGFCNKQFDKQDNIKIHIRRHTGEKPYKCQVCGKAFTASSGLRAHQIRGPPYVCTAPAKIITKTAITKLSKVELLLEKGSKLC
ncbi:zinc finger protein 850-like [Haliotis asinina]|uniref:zinc finger protein 850-like n=1 Tax=Haliotis asinina TaxID=109174 RepID=UPI00353243EE